MVYTVPSPSLFSLAMFAPDADSKAENLRLWQQQTDPTIPLADIEEVIYGNNFVDCYSSSYPGKLKEWGFSLYDTPDGNRFTNYLINSHDVEAAHFISLAKTVESLRADRNSPWYYPADKYDTASGFQAVIDQIEAYKGQRFADRYALQLIRALFASAQYAECIAAYNERLAPLPDDNLMKRMAQGYVAGAAYRLDNNEEAKAFFASTGDVESLKLYSCKNGEDALALAVSANPDAPKLMLHINGLIRSNGYDDPDSTMIVNKLLPMACKVVSSSACSDAAPWLYTIGFIEGEFLHNEKQASKTINSAYDIAKDGPLKDNIRAYRMMLDARADRTDNLLDDLKWIESKVADIGAPDNSRWTGIMQSIVLGELATRYAAKGDVIRALQFANYADNMPLNYQYAAWRDSYGDKWRVMVRPSRLNSEDWNPHDYSNTFFQYLYNQPLETVEKYLKSLGSSEPLARYLNSRGYTDSDYLNDLAGTVALRSRDYRSAITHLSKVKPEYQSRLNVERQGHLSSNPFYRYMPLSPRPVRLEDHTNAKLRFATAMVGLQAKMKSAKDPNDRADSILEYANAMNNSYNFCWALTSYRMGVCMMADTPGLTDSEDSYESKVMESAANQAYDEYAKLTDTALKLYTDPERAAIAHLSLSNDRLIAREYASTKAADFLRAHCDNFDDWIKEPSR